MAAATKLREVLGERDSHARAANGFHAGWIDELRGLMGTGQDISNALNKLGGLRKSQVEDIKATKKQLAVALLKATCPVEPPKPAGANYTYSNEQVLLYQAIRHKLIYGDDELIFAAGSAGSGKTTIMTKLPEQYIAFCAYSALAANELGGVTTHRLGGFGITNDKKGQSDAQRDRNAADQLQSDTVDAASATAAAKKQRVRGGGGGGRGITWEAPKQSQEQIEGAAQRIAGKVVVVIDEMSMLGWNGTYRLHMALQRVAAEILNNPEKYPEANVLGRLGADKFFGGWGVVFAGDFNQIPAVQDTCIFQDPPAAAPKEFTQWMLREPRTIRLLQTQRFKNDAKLEKLLDDVFVEEDAGKALDRVVQEIQVLDKEDEQEFKDATIAVCSNTEAARINLMALWHRAMEQGTPLYAMRRLADSSKVKEFDRRYVSPLLEPAAYDFFVLGVPARITKNIAPNILSISNGTIGYMHEIIFKDDFVVASREPDANGIVVLQPGDVTHVVMRFETNMRMEALDAKMRREYASSQQRQQQQQQGVVRRVGAAAAAAADGGGGRSREEEAERAALASAAQAASAFNGNNSGSFISENVPDPCKRGETLQGRWLLFPIAPESGSTVHSKGLVTQPQGKAANAIHTVSYGLPMTPAVAMTFHALQGKTSRKLIVQLNERTGAQGRYTFEGIYVAVSRATRLADVRRMAEPYRLRRDGEQSHIEMLAPPYRARAFLDCVPRHPGFVVQPQGDGNSEPAKVLTEAVEDEDQRALLKLTPDERLKLMKLRTQQYLEYGIRCPFDVQDLIKCVKSHGKQKLKAPLGMKKLDRKTANKKPASAPPVAGAAAAAAAAVEMPQQQQEQQDPLEDYFREEFEEGYAADEGNDPDMH